MENPVLLSLGKWPQQHFSRNFKTSPTSLKIIKSAKVNIDSIIPISFAEFVLENNLMAVSKAEVEQLYNRQIERRKKKIQILRGMWVKAKQHRSRSFKRTLSEKQSCITSKRTKNMKRSASKSLHKQIFTSKSRSPPQLFQRQIKTSGGTYNDYYNISNKHKVYNKGSYEEQSTKSRRQRASFSRNKYEDYIKIRDKNDGMRKQSKKYNGLKSSNKFDRKLSQLQEKHERQMQSFKDLTERQKKRLLKIYEIEKQKLKNELQSGKNICAGHKKLSKGFLQ